MVRGAKQKLVGWTPPGGIAVPEWTFARFTPCGRARDCGRTQPLHVGALIFLMRSLRYLNSSKENPVNLPGAFIGSLKAASLSL